MGTTETRKVPILKRETRVHLVNLIVGIAIVVASIAYVLYTQHQDRAAAARAVCENTNEFRSFMSSYLDSQVGKHPRRPPATTS